jgi:predicted NAD-dependent protein-ADP-ribosyltransferase YbiA (DUF1768 family)
MAVSELVPDVPINVTSRHPDPAIRLISNFAATPFELNGERYASVEGFWQSLRATNGSDRVRIAGLTGNEARRAGHALETPATITYQNRVLQWGSPEHWDVMREACRAKFTQVREAREALIATTPHMLEHRVRRESRSIPGQVMAGIWMQLRAELSLARARQPVVDGATSGIVPG